MIGISTTRTPDRRLFAAAACAALLGLLVAALTLVWPNPADSAPLKFTVLGKRVATLPPDCPGNAKKGCLTVGRMSGFQSTAGGSRNQPYEVPFDGKIVSWSIALSRPSGRETRNRVDEVAFFNEYLGKPSQARISVLRRVRNSHPVQYNLRRQSPIQVLNPYFGSTVEFALDHPLNVVKGQMVALTVPTWAPAFFHSASCEEIAPGAVRDSTRCAAFQDNNSWRASRRKGRCAFDSSDDDKLRAQLAHSYPQQKVGSRKEYGCYYVGERLLYTVTIIKKPRQSGGGGGGGGGGGANRATTSATVAPDGNGIGAAQEVTP
jgi:hypothetical protein